MVCFYDSCYLLALQIAARVAEHSYLFVESLFTHPEEGSRQLLSSTHHVAEITDLQVTEDNENTIKPLPQDKQNHFFSVLLT
jgi:hypothetical protein